MALSFLALFSRIVHIKELRNSVWKPFRFRSSSGKFCLSKPPKTPNQSPQIPNLKRNAAIFFKTSLVGGESLQFLEKDISLKKELMVYCLQKVENTMKKSYLYYRSLK